MCHVLYLEKSIQNKKTKHFYCDTLILKGINNCSQFLCFMEKYKTMTMLLKKKTRLEQK